MVTVKCSMDSFNSIVSVAVKSVEIRDELVGKEEEEMDLYCTASGGRPSPIVTWTLPEGLEFVTEEETNILVNFSHFYL